MNAHRTTVALALVLVAGCSVLKTKPKTPEISEEGRISILAFEQTLVPDTKLAGRTPSVPAAVDAKDWSQPGGPTSNAPGNIQVGDDLRVAWRENAGDGSSGKSYLSAPPVIADGKIFIIDAGQTLRALDAGSGRKLWSKALRTPKSEDKNALGGGVAVSDGRVYATTGFGAVVALKPEDGEVLWRAEAGVPFHAAPTAAGGRVYAVTTDSELQALDGASGKVQWTYQAIAEPARILAASSPAVVGDTVVAPFASGELMAFLTANGRRLWSDQLNRPAKFTSLSAINDIAGRPVISDGVIYAASHSGVLAAVDERSGQRIWSRLLASTQTPCVVGDTIYVVTVEGDLAAIDKATGGAFWVNQLPRYENEKKKKNRIVWTGPIMVGGNLFLASSEGEAVLVSPADGVVKRTIKVGDSVFVPPIAANGTVYLVNNKGQLVALR
jgi:outer membrane protein assembly factor BamB